jgi:hypothetical protein
MPDAWNVAALDICQFSPKPDCNLRYDHFFCVNSIKYAGVSKVNFCNLICQCRDCNFVMTHNVMNDHKCVTGGEDVSACRPPPNIRELLSCLDGIGGLGIPVAAFEGLFVECSGCCEILTMGVISSHFCKLEHKY